MTMQNYFDSKMTSAQVVETSVTVTNSSFQNYTHPDNHTKQTTGTPGFNHFLDADLFVHVWYPFTCLFYDCTVGGDAQ